MFDVTINISNDDVADLLCSAFESGSNYWYVIEYDKTVLPKEYWQWSKSRGRFDYVQVPLSIGGKIFINNRFQDKDEHGVLDIESITKGLHIMISKNPKHFAKFISGKWDAITADVFLQCCVFGKVVYG